MDVRKPEPLSVRANGLAQRVWVWRPGTHPDATAMTQSPMLVVHGITNSGRGWDFVCRELNADRAVNAVDLRGHGEIGKPEHGYRSAVYAGTSPG